MNRTLLPLCLILLSSCAVTKQTNQNPSLHTKMARITYYVDHRTAIGVKPKQGITVAAHPKYEFYSLIKIPELMQFIGSDTFEVQDRGSAVTSRKASHGKADVFDIYVKNRRTMNWLKREAPELMEVIIL